MRVLIIAIGALLGAMTGPGSAQTWEQEIEVAEKLLAAGYVDAAQQDFEAILRKYEDTSPAIQHAWYGLARVHMQKGEVELGRTSLEEVLKTGSDPALLASARQTYGQLKQAADFRVQQASMALQFLEYRYHSVPWYNFLAKIFTWLDVRGARKSYEQAVKDASVFDPHYLIDMPAPGSSTAASGTSGAASAGIPTGASGGDSFHLPAGTNALALPDPATASPAPRESPVPVATETAAPPPAAGTGTAASRTGPLPPPADDLAKLQRAYQDAYRQLQEAMRSGDQKRIQELNGTYQESLQRYRDSALGSRP